VVTDTQVRYRHPARLDDLLDITVQVRGAGRASFTLDQQAWCGPTLLAEGSIRIGCVDADSLRPRRIPEHVLHAMP
jgi:acyl-CoA thioester hydrolase